MKPTMWLLLLLLAQLMRERPLARPTWMWLLLLLAQLMQEVPLARPTWPNLGAMEV